MLGPHYQRLAEAERQITGKQMLERIQAHTDNPLTLVIDKLKRQFAQYQTAYTQDITNHQISSVDRLLSFDGKLGPILAALEKQNNLLRREMSLLQSQLSNSVTICQQLISQNNQLKQALMQKNADINKIIETVARNESESRDQLQQKIALLEQQNGILIQHMQEIKKKHIQYKESFENKDQQIRRLERKWTQVKKQHSETITRERQITRKLAISQHLLFEQREKYQTLENAFGLIESEKDELKAKVALFQGTQDNFNPEALRRTIENQYLDIIEQHRVLKNERQTYIRQSEKNKMQRQKLQDILNDVQKKFTKVVTEHQLVNNLLGEQKNKNQTLITTLKKLQIKIDQMKHQNVQLKMQVEAGKSATFAKQKTYEAEIQQLRKQIDQKSKQAEKKLREIKSKTQQLLDAKDLQIKGLNDTNIQLRRLSGR